MSRRQKEMVSGSMTKLTVRASPGCRLICSKPLSCRTGRVTLARRSWMYICTVSTPALVKEDGTQAQLGDELDFKVIEFNKDTQRIILSHSRTYEEAQREARKAKKAATAPRKEAAPAIQNKAAGTTLGDLDALAALKADLENNNK